MTTTTSRAAVRLMALSVLVSIAAPTARVHAASQVAPPYFSAQAAFVLDDTTGKTLYAYHADQERYPASTIKMLTALVVLQRLPLKRIVTVHADAIVGGTTANLSIGEHLRARNLLYGMLLPSGNDAAVALGDATAGSSWRFALLMNAEARRLHLWHTHAVAPDGFDLTGQYTTARDLAWMAHALLRRPLLARIVRTRVHRARSVHGRFRHVWINLNRLLWTYPGAIGVKTGTTPLAGANLVACAVRGGHRIIAVVMGSTVADRFSDAANLLNYGRQMMRAESAPVAR